MVVQYPSYFYKYSYSFVIIRYSIISIIDRSKKGANGKNVEKWENKSCIVRIVYDVL